MAVELGSMSERAPYSRVYWSIVDDPKFARVYDDDKALATWLRLLLLADQAYPASATLPRGTNTKTLALLTDVQLIDLGAGHRFRIHGLDTERARRRPAVAGPPPVVDLYRTSPSPEQDQDRSSRDARAAGAEPSLDETSRGTGTARAPDPADAYWTLTGKYPNDKVLSWVDDLSSKYGPEPVIRALAKVHVADRSTSTLLGRTQDLLRSEARALTLKEQAEARERLKERRAAPREIVDQAAVQAEIRRLMEPGAAA